MPTFKERECKRYTAIRSTTNLFPSSGNRQGQYLGKDRSYCLPAEIADENLFVGVRSAAIEYFASNEIAWHDGPNGVPSNHLCDSQVCCVNFLMALSSEPEALGALLSPVYQDLAEMLPVTKTGGHVDFEIIGKENYLGEKTGKDPRRTRGAYFTSADAGVIYRAQDHRRHLLLIEWKYTESYGSTDLAWSWTRGANGVRVRKTDRREIYRWLLEAPDCPIDIGCLPSIDVLFYEPFYQLMRQQLLAYEMQKAKEADAVTVLHVAPHANREFRRVTSPGLRALGPTVIEVWEKLVPEGFKSQSTESLFGPLLTAPPARLAAWAQYLKERYPWMVMP